MYFKNVVCDLFQFSPASKILSSGNGLKNVSVFNMNIVNFRDVVARKKIYNRYIKYLVEGKANPFFPTSEVHL